MTYDLPGDILIKINYTTQIGRTILLKNLIYALSITLSMNSFIGICSLKAMEGQPQHNVPTKCRCLIYMEKPAVNPTKMVIGGKVGNTEFYRAEQTDTHPKVYANYNKETGDYGCIYALFAGGKSAEEIRTMLDKRLPADEAFKQLKATHKQQIRISAKEIRTLLDNIKPAEEAFNWLEEIHKQQEIRKQQEIHKQQTRISKTMLKLEARKRQLKARHKQQQQETPSKKPRNKKRFDYISKYLEAPE